LNPSGPFAGNAPWLTGTSAQNGNYFPASTLDPFNFGPLDENFNITFTMDGIILGRSGLDAQVIAVDGSGNPVLSSEDIDLGAQIGPRVSVFMGGRQTGLEFAFFGLNELSFQDVVNQNGVTPYFFGGFPANPVESYDIHYRSRLYSAELMFWSPVAEIARVGAGIRGVGLSETFDILQTGESITTGFFSETETDLLGFQIGGGVPLLRRQYFYIDATAKTGVYHQASDLSAIAQNVELHEDEVDVTAVTELNIGGEYHFGRHVSLRGGYLVLWLHDVALGPNQNDDWDIINGTGGFDTNTAVFQGGYFGFQVRW
jgi:hypothetical protein